MIEYVKVYTGRNPDGITVDLTNPRNFDDHHSGFAIDSIDGLGPVEADINTTEMAVDGDVFNSARIGKRNIVLNLIFFSENGGSTIEEIRMKSYEIFPLKSKVRIEVKTATRWAEITGYVEKNEPDIFSEMESAQVSIICPDPRWYEHTLYPTRGIHKDEVTTLTYRGDMPVGGLMKITFNSQSAEKLPSNGEDPLITVSCTNNEGDTDQQFKLFTPEGGYDTDDAVYISSKFGDKKVYWFDYSAHDTNSPALNLLGTNPGWITLSHGENNIEITGDVSAISMIEFSYYEAYGGV